MGQRLTQHDGTNVMASVPGVGSLISHGDGAPTDSVQGFAKGGLWLDTTNGRCYINHGTRSSSNWGTNPGWLNVMDYGAVADGTTDDGPAIQAAIDAAEAAGDGTVYLPTGEYSVQTGVAIDDEYVSMWGDGVNATHINGSGAIDVITLSDAATGMRLSHVFGNFHLSGSNNATTLLKVGRVVAGQFLNIRINNAGDLVSGIGLHIDGAQNCVWQAIETVNCDIGLYIDNDSLNHEFIHVTSKGNATNNIKLEKSDAGATSAPRNIRFRGGLNETLDSSATTGCLIEDCHDVAFDCSQSACIDENQIAYHLNGANVHGVKFLGVQFMTNATTGTCLKMSGACDATIDSLCHFRQGNIGINAEADATLYLGTYRQADSGFTTFFSGISGATEQDVIQQTPIMRTKAGAPIDGDFETPPIDGALAVDETNDRLYVRVGGTWKYADLT